METLSGTVVKMPNTRPSPDEVVDQAVRLATNLLQFMAGHNLQSVELYNRLGPTVLLVERQTPRDMRPMGVEAAEQPDAGVVPDDGQTADGFAPYRECDQCGREH